MVPGLLCERAYAMNAGGSSIQRMRDEYSRSRGDYCPVNGPAGSNVGNSKKQGLPSWHEPSVLGETRIAHRPTSSESAILRSACDLQTLRRRLFQSLMKSERGSRQADSNRAEFLASTRGWFVQSVPSAAWMLPGLSSCQGGRILISAYKMKKGRINSTTAGSRPSRVTNSSL